MFFGRQRQDQFTWSQSSLALAGGICPALTAATAPARSLGGTDGRRQRRDPTRCHSHLLTLSLWCWNEAEMDKWSKTKRAHKCFSWSDPTSPISNIRNGFYRPGWAASCLSSVPREQQNVMSTSILLKTDSPIGNHDCSASKLLVGLGNSF